MIRATISPPCPPSTITALQPFRAPTTLSLHFFSALLAYRFVADKRIFVAKRTQIVRYVVVKYAFYTVQLVQTHLAIQLRLRNPIQSATRTFFILHSFLRIGRFTV